ncbi:hypothetical protein FRB95_005640 [Tulasnella sp. JGI-2019a]|nr:hypothetical protein FRB95_005640 [Tulasnella sp. JGI-2019a]
MEPPPLNQPSHPPAGTLLRRFSTQSNRTVASSNFSHGSNPHQQSSNHSKYRTLQQQSRGSKPPLTSISRPMGLPINNPSSGRPPITRGHSSQRSFTGSAADLTTTFLGSVKRSLSLSKDKKDRDRDLSQSSNYYGMTPEEDAARVYGLGAHKPLLAAPTFQQIASGVAVQAPRGRPPSRQSSPQLPPQPRRSSMKRTSIQSMDNTPTGQSSAVFPSFNAFNSSAPSLPQQQQHVQNPSHVHVQQLMHAATVASSSTASFSTSSASGSGSGGSSGFPATPALNNNGTRRGAKHKISLSLAALTGRMRMGTLSRPGSSGANSNVSSIDSGVGWVLSTESADVTQKSPRKAVRFSDPDDADDVAMPPQPSFGIASAGLPTSRDGLEKSKSVDVTGYPRQRPQHKRVGSDAVVSSSSAAQRPAAAVQQTTSFGQRTARFFSR